MSLIVADRVQETTNTTGTGAYILGGASPGFQAFSVVTSNADTVYYSVTDNVDFEVGLGTYASSGNLISRTTVFSSSNSNNAVSWGVGTKNIFLTYPADKAVIEDVSNNVTIGNNLVVGGTVDGVDIQTLNTTANAALPKAGGTMTGDLVLNADPTAALQSATKQYVDTIAAAGIHYHQACRAETTANLNATYSNGSSGVGATLTNAGTQAALVLDGVTLVATDRVMVQDQTNTAHNGVYTVTTVGSGSTNWVLTRATDADSYSPSDPDALGEGDAFFITEGTVHGGELDVMTTSGVITFGTTGIVFAQVSDAPIYTAGAGLSISGTEFSLVTPVTSATALATARTIGMTGDVVWTSATFDGTGNVTGVATIQPNSVTLGTDTTGSYVGAGATSGTGLSGSLSGEGGTFTVTSNATNANTASTIVARDGSGNFSAGTITGALSGNATTATSLASGRTIGMTGDVVWTSASFDGSGNVTGTATIQANSVALGTDTTGNYVSSIANGSYLTGGGSASENKAYTLGVDATSANTASKVVARDSSSNFSAGTVTAALTGNASTATALQNARTINGVSFNGTANITVADSTKLPLAGGTLNGGVTIDSGNGDQLLLDNAGERYTQISFKHNGAQEAAIWYDATDNFLVAHASSGDGFKVQTGGSNDRLTIDASGNVATNGTTFKSDSNTDRNFKLQASATGTSVGLSHFYGNGSHGYQLYASGTSYGFLDGNWAQWDIQKVKNGQFKVDEGAGLQHVFNDGYHPNADKWTTARTLTLSGDATGSVSWDGSANASLTVAVTDDSHNHVWGNIDGGSVNSWGGLRHTTAGGYIDFGPANSSYAHIYTDRGSFYFNKQLLVNGDTVWTAGNDGSGSGLDADLLDGVQGNKYFTSYNNAGTTGWEDSNRNFRINSGGTSVGFAMHESDGTFGFNLYADGANYGFLDANWGNWDIKKVTNGALYVDEGSGLQRVFTDGYHPNANAWTTARTLTLSGDVTGSVSWDGSANASISASLTASPSVTNLNVATSIIHTGDTNTGINFDTDQINIAVGGSIPLYVNTTGVRLGDSGNGYFQPVSGNYGSIQIDGGNHGGWEGYSIGGRMVFMHDNSDACGIYNDVDNEWLFYGRRNGLTRMYYNGSNVFETTSSGADLIGNLAVTGTVDGRDVAADGTKLDGIAAGATNTAPGLPLSGGTLTGDLTIPSKLIHSGDTDTYMQFNTNEIVFRTGGVDSLTINPSDITSLEPIAAPYFEATSDINLKTNIKKIVSPLEMLSNLNGYTFNWKKDGKASTGVMAQEVEKVLPSAVSENNDGDKRVNYNELVGVLIEAVKEQQIQIDALKNKLGE